MSGAVKLVKNAAGRRVPEVVNGKSQTPFQGVGRYRSEASKHGPRVHSCADYPSNGDKRVANLETALRQCGLRDGMVISSHHHLRDGDRIGLLTLETAARMGTRDLMWFPSASFPCHAPVIDLMEAGAVHHI